MARKQSPLEDLIDNVLAPITGILALGIVGWVFTHPHQATVYAIIAVVVVVLGGVGYILWRKRHNPAQLEIDEEKILYMLKGMTPARFEEEMARMFTALGYSTELNGGPGDGGIDIIAEKNGKRYFIQCKKFITREVTPHDVRDFLGAITNVNNPAERGFFITTNKFTLAAERAAEGNGRIELIDGRELVQHYKMAQGKMPSETHIPEPEPPAPQAASEKCVRCGGDLVLRTAKHGDRAGRQFWGCSNFAKMHCNFIRDVAQPPRTSE